MAKSKKEKPLELYIVVSYVDGNRRLHKASATSYRGAKRQIAKELREDLGLWDTTLADISAAGMMIARKAPKGGRLRL